MAISGFDMVSTVLYTLFTQSKVIRCGRLITSLNSTTEGPHKNVLNYKMQVKDGTTRLRQQETSVSN